MANWDILKRAISDVIKTNGNQEITGQLLQQVLLNIVTSVGANATFAGVATPTTNPGTPDGPVFYLASEPGNYVNFNNFKVTDTVCILKWSNSIWLSEDTHILTYQKINAKFSELESKTSEISKEAIETEDDSISIEDNNGNEVFHLDENGLDAKNVKSNGKDVLTEHQDISGLATKEEVENVKVKEISSEITEDTDSAVVITTDDDEPVTEIHAELNNSSEECQSWNSDDYDENGNGEQYAKITPKGVMAKGFFDLHGNPIVGGGSAPNVLEVSTKGGKQFETITSAVEYAKTIESASNPITILIYPGVYKEVVILGAGHYISFVGVNKKDVIWRDDTGYYENAPLKIASASYIANITFIATHNDTPGFEDETRTPSYLIGSYALHIDTWSNNYEEATIIVENCDCYSEQNAALGLGVENNKTVIFRNCNFETYMNDKMWQHPDHDKGAWLCHKGTGTESYNQNIILDNCNIRKNRGAAMEIGGFSYALHGVTFRAYRNMAYSDEKGTTDIVRTYPSGGASRYEISADSYGNNINDLNNSIL